MTKRPHIGRTEHMIGSIPGCPGCEDYLARKPLLERVVTRLTKLGVVGSEAGRRLDIARAYAESLEPTTTPDSALAIVTDAALEYAHLLDGAEGDHATTLAMEIREAVAELDRRRA